MTMMRDEEFFYDRIDVARAIQYKNKLNQNYDSGGSLEKEDLDHDSYNKSLTEDQTA